MNGANCLHRAKESFLDAVTYPGQKWIVFSVHQPTAIKVHRIASIMGAAQMALMALFLSEEGLGRSIPGRILCSALYGFTALGVGYGLPYLFYWIAFLFPRPNEPREVTENRSQRLQRFCIELTPNFQ